MGRLQSSHSRIGGGGGRLSSPARINHEKVREVQAPWRPLYGKARWKRLRQEVWLRDGYICQQTGEKLAGTYPAPDSPVANHIIAAHVFWWDGRRYLFWDIENLETVAKHYHDKEIQEQEQRARLGR